MYGESCFSQFLSNTFYAKICCMFKKSVTETIFKLALAIQIAEFLFNLIKVTHKTKIIKLKT